MEKSRFIKVWDGLYPFLIFYAFSQLIVIGLIYAFSSKQTMIIQNVVQTIMLLPMGFFMRKYSIGWNQKRQQGSCKIVVCILVSSALFSLSLNQIIDALQIKAMSDGYLKVSDAIFIPGKLQILLCVGILAPIFEEVIYRGILFGAFRKNFGFVGSAVLSSLIFGGLHMNMVQFLYAASMGYIFAYYYEKTNKMIYPILAHVFANVTSLVVTWTGFSQWIFAKPFLSLFVAFVEGLIGIAFLSVLRKFSNSKKNIKYDSK